MAAHPTAAFAPTFTSAPPAVIVVPVLGSVTLTEEPDSARTQGEACVR